MQKRAKVINLFILEKPFSNILEKYGIDAYNQEVEESLLKIKQTLAKKAISIENNSIYNALSITDVRMM